MQSFRLHEECQLKTEQPVIEREQSLARVVHEKHLGNGSTFDHQRSHHVAEIACMDNQFELRWQKLTRSTSRVKRQQRRSLCK
jgi:hypothetical protein